MEFFYLITESKMMKNLTLLLSLLLFAGCGNSSRANQANASETATETESNADTIPVQVATLPEASHELSDTATTVNFVGTLPHAGPYTVEDTVKYQIGRKLYYEEADLSDSITVYKARHFEHNGELYSTYHYVIHNTRTKQHKVFNPSSIAGVYDKGKKEDFWQELIKQQDTVRVGHISPAIGKYTGYWIFFPYVEELDDYILDSYMGALDHFEITEKYYVAHYMDGLYPYKLANFREMDTGFVMEFDGQERVFELVDRKRQIYQFRPSGQKKIFCTPARNYNQFKISVSVNTSGDRI